MSATAPGSLSFRRIIDIPLEMCVAALDHWQRAGHDGELRFGESQVLGPVEHDRDSGTRRLEVRLARGPLRPILRMRLDIDRWSSSSTALELIPCGRIRPSAAYFRAGHLLLDSLTRSLPQDLPPAQARDTASQAHVPAGSVRLLARPYPAGLVHVGMTAVARALTDQCAGYVLELRQNGAQIASQAWNYAINGSAEGQRVSPPAVLPSLAWDTGIRMHVASCSKMITAIALTKLLSIHLPSTRR